MMADYNKEVDAEKQRNCCFKAYTDKKVSRPSLHQVVFW
jgi:hypothetical protein